MDHQLVGAVILYTVLMIISNGKMSDAALAMFTDGRCEPEADGVCPNDPLVFTCELNEVAVLRVIFPNGYSEILSDGTSDEDDVVTPPGFTAVSFEATVIDASSRNFVLTLSIANASLLNGSNITCDDATPNNRVMAGCPLLDPLPPRPDAPSSLRQLQSSNTATTATITWDSAGDDVTYTVTSSSLTSPVTGIEDESYTLMDLQVETDYTVTVTATNECGDESPPSTITVRIDVREPLPPTFEEPRFYCRNDGETMTLVDIQWTYADLRGPTASGLVDVPISSVAVYYTAPDSSELIGACSDDDACTCDDVDGSDTSCSLYLPITDSPTEAGDNITVVLNVSNEGIVDGLFTETRQLLESSLLDVDDSGLTASPPTVEVTLTQFCESETQFFVRVSFGKKLSIDDGCESKESVTVGIERSGQSVTIDVNEVTTLMLGEDEQYCFAGATIVNEPTSTTSGGGNDADLPPGVIAAVVVGGGAGVGLAGGSVFIVIFLIHRHNKKKRNKPDGQEMNIVSPVAKSDSTDTGATYQDPNTITHTPHPFTGEVYTDVNLDKKKKTKQDDAGPMYQDPNTIEHQAGPSGELYAMPQQEKKKGKKKGKREETEKEEEEGELSEEQKASLYSVPDKKGQKAKSEGLNYAQLDLHRGSQQAPPSKGSMYVDVKHPPN